MNIIARKQSWAQLIYYINRGLNKKLYSFVKRGEIV
jgi:hypothetical protein